MTPVQSAQEYVDSGCDPASKEHIEALIAECGKLERYAYVRGMERDAAYHKVENVISILMGVHALMYPPIFTTPDGIHMAFSPKDPTPNAILQELSDRIRAIPDKVLAARKEQS